MGLFSGLFGGKKSDAPYPSWGSSESKIRELMLKLQVLTAQKDIPEKFLAGIMSTDYSINRVMFTAGLWEQQGASFEKQTSAIMEYIEKCWSNIDDKEKWFD